MDPKNFVSPKELVLPKPHVFGTESLRSDMGSILKTPIAFLSLFVRVENFASSIELSSVKPHRFVNNILCSDMGLTEILVEVNQLLPQFSLFIDRFFVVVNHAQINVITDATGGMIIDYTRCINAEGAEKVRRTVEVLDGLIQDRGDKINDYLNQARVLEDRLKLQDPNYKSQILNEVQELARLRDKYRH